MLTCPFDSSPPHLVCCSQSCLASFCCWRTGCKPETVAGKQLLCQTSGTVMPPVVDIFNGFLPDPSSQQETLR